MVDCGERAETERYHSQRLMNNHICLLNFICGALSVRLYATV